MTDLECIHRAQEGDAKAVDALVRSQQDRVHRLAARMLGNVEDARDATQDILLRMITNLSQFEGRASFDTWVHRIAVNHLLTARKILAKAPKLSFDQFEADLAEGLADEAHMAPEDHVMLGEMRLRCTMAMLICLPPEQRAAYVLGEVFELSQAEACDILDLAPTTYRKRLSRARQDVQDFTARACGVVSETAACTCRKRLPAAQAMGRVPQQPSPALAGAPEHAEIVATARRTEAALRSAKLQRGTGPLHAPPQLSSEIMDLLALKPR